MKSIRSLKRPAFLRGFILFSALIIAGLMASHSANAQYNFRSKLMPATPLNSYISLVRTPDLAPGQFTLRISMPYTATACAKMGNPYYMTNVQPPYMTINIMDGDISHDDLPQYAHFQCDTSLQNPHADVVLSKEQIMQGGIHRIILQDSTYKMRKDLDIDINDSYVHLMDAPDSVTAPNAYQPQKLSEKPDPLMFWFYPNNTYIVYVPMADNDQHLKEQVTKLAAHEGMVPLSSVLPGFKSPITKPNHFYFVAKNNKDVGEEGQLLGKIETTKQVYGLVGPEEEKETLDVYFRQPGLYE